MNISNRAAQVPFSPIRKLAKYADDAKARGIHVYHLNIGQPDIETPECALEAIINCDRKILDYSPSQGIFSLRKKMTEYYARYDINITPEDIIVTVGGSEAILFTLMTCLDPGDELLITDPSYANYLSFSSMCGIVVKTIKTSIEDDFRLPPIEKFEEQITPKTKALLICNPNNPTGYLYSEEELLKIRDFVKKHNLYLISDEVYREFKYSSKKYLSALHLNGIEENAIIVDSVSKRYSECGIRIGAVVTKNELVKSSVLKFCQARLSPPLIGQIVAEASIDTPQSYLDNVYNEYIERRNFFVNELNKIPGVYSPMPEGAFYTMVKLPVDDVEKFCKWCLTDFSYEGETIMIAPGSGFYLSKNDGVNEARMAYVLKKEDLAKAVIILRKALEAYSSLTQL